MLPWDPGGVKHNSSNYFTSVWRQPVQCEIPEPCQRQEDTSDLQFSANLACKWLIIFVAMDWHHDIYLLNLIAVKLQCMTMNLNSSSSVHRQWCNHSMMEMVRSLGSCQGSVQVVISTWANCLLNHVRSLSQRRSTTSNFNGSPVVAAWGQAAFQVVGNVTDRPLQGGCKVGQAMEKRWNYKRARTRTREGIEQEQTQHVLPLSKNLLL